MARVERLPVVIILSIMYKIVDFVGGGRDKSARDKRDKRSIEVAFLRKLEITNFAKYCSTY